MGDLVANLKESIDSNIFNLKKTHENQSVSSKSSSSESSEVLKVSPSTNFSPYRENPESLSPENPEVVPKLLVSNQVEQFSRLSRSSSSSSSSSILSDHPAEEGLKIKIESEDQQMNKFSLSSPILKPAPKSREFSETGRNPPRFDFEFLESKEKLKNNEEVLESDESFTDEDTVNDLQMLDDALTPAKPAQADFIDEGFQEENEKNELDQAVVMENSLDRSRSSSSSSSNSEILKEIKEEPESPEKFKPSDLYQHQVDSPGLVEQAVSYLPSDLLEEKMMTDQRKEKNDQKAENLEKPKKQLEDKENKKSEPKDFKVAQVEESKDKNYSGPSYSKTEKEMIKNSLTEAKRYENSYREDPKGSSVCAKCLIL